ncbi:hypothetical protein SLE2022_097190 [Rubroshorea leprosula]
MVKKAFDSAVYPLAFYLSSSCLHRGQKEMILTSEPLIHTIKGNYMGQLPNLFFVSILDEADSCFNILGSVTKAYRRSLTTGSSLSQPRLLSTSLPSSTSVLAAALYFQLCNRET